MPFRMSDVRESEQRWGSDQSCATLHPVHLVACRFHLSLRNYFYVYATPDPLHLFACLNSSTHWNLHKVPVTLNCFIAAMLKFTNDGLQLASVVAHIERFKKKTYVCITGQLLRYVAVPVCSLMGQ